MTPEDQELILSLVVIPGRPAPTTTADDILQHFGASDGSELGIGLLRDAVRRRDGVDVEMALIVVATFEATPEFLTPLTELISADWHQKHEDVVSVLDRLRDPAALPALYEATQWIPDYLDYDESRALARKAIWAIGKTPGPAAEQILVRLSRSEDDILREEAERQLDRRNRNLGRS